jgi:hypothetical protein
MVEHAGNAELVFGLFQELEFFLTMNEDDLEGVVAAIGYSPDVHDGTVSAGAQRCEYLELADTETHGLLFSPADPNLNRVIV